MRKNSYKQMLVESLIDISSMTSYKGPAQKVLDAKDEKFETHRSATSDVDVLGRAYAGQEDWDNIFITEGGDDMDEENLEQGEPQVSVTLPDQHDPDVTDLEDNIDESDPDKLYQKPITGEKDATSKLNVEGAEDPVSLDTTEDDEDEDEEDDGVISEPTDDIPTQDEFQNSDPDIATEGDEDLGDDLPEDEPIEDDEFPEDTASDDVDDLGDDLPEDEPIEEDVEDGEVITNDQEPLLGDDLPEDEPPAGDFPEEHLDEEDEDLGDDLPEDIPEDEAEEEQPVITDDTSSVEDGGDLGEDLPEDEPTDDGVAMEGDEDGDIPADDDDLPQDDPDGGCPNCGNDPCTCDDDLDEDPDLSESLMENDVTMDPNAALPPAGAPPPADPNAAPADPNAAPPPADPNAAPADPNAAPPADPNDPNAGLDPNAQGEQEEQDPILDVDSNVVADDTSKPPEEGAEGAPQPTSESVMESLIVELGTYADHNTTDLSDLYSADIDD